MTGIEVAILVTTIAASTAATVHQAQQANKAAMRSAQAANANAARRYRHIQMAKDQKTKQSMAARDVEAMKIRNKAAKVAGRVKVAQAEGGFTTSGEGSGAMILDQVGRDEAFNQDMLSQNTGNMLARINSEYGAANIETQGSVEAQLAAAQAQMSSVFLAGLSGAIGGTGTGLGMVSAGRGAGMSGFMGPDGEAIA